MLNIVKLDYHGCQCSRPDDRDPRSGPLLQDARRPCRRGEGHRLRRRRRARSSVCSVPTGPARRPRCACSRPCSSRRPAGDRRRPRPRPQPREVRRRIGYVAQVGATPAAGTVVGEELDHAGPPAGPEQGRRRRAARRARAAARPRRPRARARCSSCPGGQRRRFDIALGLMHAPTLVVPRRADHRAGPAEPREPVGAHPLAARRRA